MNLKRLGAYFLGSAIALLLIAANAAGQAPLGAASTYAVLAGAGVTSTGSSVIDGNIGSIPTTAVGGFPQGTVAPPFTVTSTTAAAAAAAQTDLTTAYNTLVACRVQSNTVTIAVQRHASAPRFRAAGRPLQRLAGDCGGKAWRRRHSRDCTRSSI